MVSQEPVYDLYRYLYMNRVRFENSLATPALYDAIAGTPGAAGDSIAYQTNALNDTSRPACPALNWADQQDSNHSSPYWQQRDLISATRGKKTPLFLTQGFIENNTKPDGAYDLWNGMAGPKRAWFGMWDHVRGNDTDENGRLLMGRAGWFGEVMHWFDYYLKGQGKNPTSVDPPIAVESGNGKWRSEKSWPPADAVTYKANLKPGTYTDDAQNNGTAEGGSPNGQGIWTFSPPFKSEARFAGVPRITFTQHSLLQNANFTADVYDVDAQNNATLISRGTFLLGGTGTSSFDLYGDDWVHPGGPPDRRAGHVVELGVVGPRAHASGRPALQRHDHAAVPEVQAHGDDPGRALGEARELPRRRAVRGRPGHDHGQHRPGVPAAARGGELHAVDVHSLTGTGRRDAR